MRLLSRFFSKKEKLKFVLDSDLENYLKSLGIYSAIQKGQLKCMFCGDRITLASFSALVPDNNAVKAVCSKYSCVNKLSGND